MRQEDSLTVPSVETIASIMQCAALLCTTKVLNDLEQGEGDCNHRRAASKLSDPIIILGRYGICMCSEAQPGGLTP